MKRPIIYLTLGYIIGIIWGLYCKNSIVFLYLIIGLIYIILKNIFKTHKKFKIISFKRYYRYVKLIFNKKAIILIVIISIISNSIILYQNIKYESLYSNIKNQIKVKGTIIKEEKQKSYKYRYKIKVDDVNGNKSFKNTCLILEINKKINQVVEYGDKVEINGVFKDPSINTNYKGFNYKEYLKTVKIYGTLETKNIKILKKNNLNSVSIIANKISKVIKNNIKQLVPNEEGDILIGVLFGDTLSIDDNTKEIFKISNISHILAVSGMHISYIVIGLSYSLKFLGKKASNIVISIILLFYIVITNYAPSVVRASSMTIILLFSKVFYKKNDIWTSLSISILILLLYNPFLIKNVSVQYSYGGTIGIVLFQKNVLSFIDRLKIKNKNKFFIERNKSEVVNKIVNKVKEIISVTISAQIVIMPIMIMNFNTFGIYFLVTNLIVSFIIGPVIILGFLMVILSFISFDLVSVFSKILIYLIDFLIILSQNISEFKFSNIYLKTPSFVSVLFYYILIVIFNVLYSMYNKKLYELTFTQIRVKNIISLIKYKVRCNIKSVISIVLIVCLVCCVIKIVPRDLNIYFIDVGQGDSTLIKTPYNKTILIDGGGSLSGEFDVGKSVLLPYLLDRKISKVDYVFVSHFDQDHVGRFVFSDTKYRCRKGCYL